MNCAQEHKKGHFSFIMSKILSNSLQNLEHTSYIKNAWSTLPFKSLGWVCKIFNVF